MTRALLERSYPHTSLEGFVPTHHVRIFSGSLVSREDYVALKEPDSRGIRYGFVPGREEALYAVISNGKWQCFEGHGLIKDDPIRYVADYVPPSACDGFVYFVQSGEGGPIKIGWSQDVERRILQLQTANAHRLHLIGRVPGRMEDEAAMHAKFAHLRMEGEWFRDHSEIREYLRQVGGTSIDDAY